MKVDQFIEQAIETLRKNLPQLKEIVYKFKENSEIHFLKIIPETIFDEKLFAEICDQITTEYYDLNLPGSLCFIKDELIVNLDSPNIVRHFGSNIFYDYVYNVEFTEIATIEVENKSLISNLPFGLKYNVCDSIFFSKTYIDEPISYYSESIPRVINSITETRFSTLLFDAIKRTQPNFTDKAIVKLIQKEYLESVSDNNSNYALAA